MTTFTETDHVPSSSENINTARVCYRPSYHPQLLSIAHQLSATPSPPSMKTRKKNQTAHPGIPDMTPSQLLSAGLSRTSNTRRSSNTSSRSSNTSSRSSSTSSKKLTKDQQIAALNDELRAIRELISSVSWLYTGVRYVLTAAFIF